MSSRKLHFGIIGAGRIGGVHAETLAFCLPEAETVAIADVNREAAEAFRRRKPGDRRGTERPHSGNAATRAMLCIPGG
jgi:predicted dehydrogenase